MSNSKKKSGLLASQSDKSLSDSSDESYELSKRNKNPRRPSSLPLNTGFSRHSGTSRHSASLRRRQHMNRFPRSYSQYPGARQTVNHYYPQPMSHFIPSENSAFQSVSYPNSNEVYMTENSMLNNQPVTSNGILIRNPAQNAYCIPNMSLNNISVIPPNTLYPPYPPTPLGYYQTIPPGTDTSFSQQLYCPNNYAGVNQQIITHPNQEQYVPTYGNPQINYPVHAPIIRREASYLRTRLIPQLQLRPDANCPQCIMGNVPREPHILNMNLEQVDPRSVYGRRSVYYPSSEYGLNQEYRLDMGNYFSTNLGTTQGINFPANEIAEGTRLIPQLQLRPDANCPQCIMENVPREPHILNMNLEQVDPRTSLIPQLQLRPDTNCPQCIMENVPREPHILNMNLEQVDPRTRLIPQLQLRPDANCPQCIMENVKREPNILNMNLEQVDPGTRLIPQLQLRPDANCPQCIMENVPREPHILNMNLEQVDQRTRLIPQLQLRPDANCPQCIMENVPREPHILNMNLEQGDPRTRLIPRLQLKPDANCPQCIMENVPREPHILNMNLEQVDPRTRLIPQLQLRPDANCPQCIMENVPREPHNLNMNLEQVDPRSVYGRRSVYYPSSEYGLNQEYRLDMGNYFSTNLGTTQGINFPANEIAAFSNRNMHGYQINQEFGGGFAGIQPTFDYHRTQFHQPFHGGY